jgi:hypothetical protein
MHSATCGEVTFRSRKRSFTLLIKKFHFTPLIKKCHKHYFGCKVGDQDKSSAAHFCCVTCARLLAAWAKGSHCMPSAIPMLLREPTDHVSVCCYCLTSITGITAKSKHTVQYPNLSCVNELPVLKPPTNMTLNDGQLMKM